MKEIKTTADITNATAIDLGPLAEIKAEAHNLCVALALGVEVRAALTAAHRKTGEGVLEGLLEAEELDNALVYAGMEAKTALVRTDCAVELNTVAAVNYYVAVIVYPRNSELNNSFGLNESFDNSRLYILGALLEHGLDGLENLAHGLMELRLAGIAALNTRHQIVKIF